MNGLNKGFLRKVIKMMCQTPVYEKEILNNRRHG